VEVFDYMADFSNAVLWDPGVKSSIRSDSGELGEGSGFSLEVKVGKRAYPIDYRIVEYRRPSKVVLLGETTWMRSLDAILVSPVQDGSTVIEYVANLHLKGVLSMLNPLLATPFAKIGARAMEGLAKSLPT
jgi:hypothetical protein